MQLRLVFLLSASFLATGCATITHDTNQSVQIETYTKNQERVLDAKCTAKNERGSWEATSPGTVSVHRSADNLLVQCEKQGYEPGNVTAISRANGGMFGNIVFGGGVGAIIDHNKGTAYTYPTWLRVIMGESLVIDKRDQSDENKPAEAKPTSVAKASASPAATAEASSPTANQ